MLCCMPCTEGAHDSRLPLFPDVPCSLGGDFVSHADREGRNSAADGAVEHSATRGRTHDRGTKNSPGLNGAGSVMRGRADGRVRPLRIASSAASSSSVVVTWVSV